MKMHLPVRHSTVLQVTMDTQETELLHLNCGQAAVDLLATCVQTSRVMATTQNAMAFVTESTTSSTSETEKLREVEYRILHPDQSLYCLKLPYKATGFDCLDQVGN